MQIAVLSDFHLGAKNRLDRFDRAHEAEIKLLRLLERLERSVDKIILLGDVFETLRGPAPGPMQSQLRAAMEAYPEISRRATEHSKYHLVPGNHDVITESMLNAPPFLHLEDHGVRMTFFHGHQLDWLARRSAPLSRLGVWTGGMLERLGLPVTHHVDRHRGYAYVDGPKPDPQRFEHAALAVGRHHRADIVVNGHTHTAIKHTVGDQVYLNSGTCLAGRREVVMIDTETRQFEIVIDD